MFRGKIMENNLYLFDDKMTPELEKGLVSLDENSSLQIKIDDTLTSAIQEMNSLQNEYSGIGTENLIDLCKDNVMATIVGQFGLASLFIESRDGGNVTTTHNFKKGIVSSEADSQKYKTMQENRERPFSEIRHEAGYDKKLSQMHMSDAQAGKRAVKDEYTGKTISITRADIDHVVSAHEIEFDPANNLFLNQKDRVAMATDDTNLAYTKDSVNRSKGKKSMEQWLDQERSDGRTNEQAFDIDRNLALEKDKIARKKMSETVSKAAFQKYSHELLVTGGKDAARMMSYATIGVLIHDFGLAVIEELKFILKNKGRMSFKELFQHFKNKMSEVMSELRAKWKDVLKGAFESGILAFLSNILVFVINLFGTTLKKLVAMIRAGFISLYKALKIMVHKPSGISQDDANYEAAKIFTTGIIEALFLGLSAVIEKFLQSIPGLQPLMMFPIPSFGQEQRTVSDVIAVTLSAVAGGIVSTIAIYFMDQCRNNARKDHLQIRMVTTSGVIVQCKIAQSLFALNNAYNFFAQVAKDERETLAQTYQKITSSKAETDKGLTELEELMKAF